MAAPKIKTTAAELTTSSVAITTAPAGFARHITMCQVCNIDGSNDVDITLLFTDSSNSDTAFKLANLVTVAAKDSRSMLAGSFALEPGDVLKAQASANSDADIIVSYYDEAI